MSENPSTWGELAGLTLTKGHGTGNDFIFLTDENAEIALTPELVARACDRLRHWRGRLHSCCPQHRLPRGSEAARGAPGRCLVHGLPQR